MCHCLVVIEKAGKNYSAYSPDLPGCVATGRTREAAERNIHKAIEMHIQSMIEDRQPIPKPHAVAKTVVIA
jgi:predicted RNase H-like HicB family nuclease